MTAVFQQPFVLLTTLLSAGLAFSLILPANRVDVIRTFSLGLSSTALLVGLLSCLSFNKTMAGFQFTSRVDLLPQYNLSFTLGADGLSMVFLLLTLFIFPICFLSSWSVNKQTKQFFNYLLAMELLLVLTFATLDIFCFYVFFESLLIPMFILIGVWGARERKIKAAYYFFLYTLFGSLFMLFGLLYLYLLAGSNNYYVILNTPLAPEQQKLIWICFFFAFAVKMPLFPFHIWLPEAHVEAPTVGSMLLASLLLKLGGYGFLRFSISMLPAASAYFMPIIATLSLLGVVYGSLSTIRQIDLKRIIAYSSVAHMNLVMLGLFSESQQGVEGAIYLMVGHGVVSAALFFCIGIVYDRYHTRLLRYYGGLVTVMPLFVSGFFMFTLANMSFPGTSNFLGEFLLFLGVFSKNSAVLLFATTSIVLSAVYSVWLFNRLCFGTLKTKYIGRFTDVTRRELAVLGLLAITMLLLGVFASFVLNFSYFSVSELALGSAGVSAILPFKGRVSSTSVASRLGYLVARAQTSRVYDYAWVMFIGLCAYVVVSPIFFDAVFAIDTPSAEVNAPAEATSASAVSPAEGSASGETADTPCGPVNKDDASDQPESDTEEDRAWRHKKKIFFIFVLLPFIFFR